MFAEWTAECSSEDPVLVVPWETEPGGARFVDLREHPYDYDHLPEVQLYPPLMQALRALNAARSPVFTAKCDGWVMPPGEVEGLRLNLDAAWLNSSAHAEDAPLVGFASYIDVIWRERGVFASSHQHEQILHRLVRHAGPLEEPSAGLECVLRPAIVDLEGAQEGFAVTLYVKAVAADADEAQHTWGRALAAVVGLVRSKDLALGRGLSATISAGA